MIRGIFRFEVPPVTFSLNSIIIFLLKWISEFLGKQTMLGALVASFVSLQFLLCFLIRHSGSFGSESNAIE